MRTGSVSGMSARQHSFLEKKTWTNQALQDQEEALAPVRAEVLKRAGSSHEASTGVKSTAGLEQRNLRKRFLVFLRTLVIAGQQTPFSFSKNITSERPHAHLLAVIRW